MTRHIVLQCAHLEPRWCTVAKSGQFDIAFVGHYTKDTIVYPHVTRTVDGGAFNYGANVAARMGLQAAVVTRLAREDWHVVDEWQHLGVTMFTRATPASTCLRLIYPSANLDEALQEIKEAWRETR